MDYDVIWHPKAISFLRKLPKDTATRIVKKVRETKKNPKLFLEHLRRQDFHKLRAGDYRLLIDISHAKRQLKIQHIGHRKNIYKKK